MRAITIERAGGWEQLRLVERPEPPLETGRVLVDVAAAGVNFADVVVRLGLYKAAKQYVGWPITPGFEVAGVVRAVGAGVSGFSPGDRVFGCTRFNGYQSVVCLPPALLRPVPKGLSLVQAATFPTVFLTAWYALRECCKLRPGNKVLVHSAAGGVGCAALQVARAAGAIPYAVVGSAHKVDVARRFGAEAVVDKSREPLWPALERLVPDRFDVVLEPNGVETLLESYRHLRPTGRVVVYGAHTMFRRGGGTVDWVKLAWDYFRTPRFDPIRMTESNKSVMAFNLSQLFERLEIFEEALGELAGWMAAGKLVPLPVTTFPLARVAEAHRALESGSTVGKLALVMDPLPGVDVHSAEPQAQQP